MTEAKKIIDLSKPDDYITRVERTPRARIFTIKDGESNEVYEKLLAKMEKDPPEVEHSSSSGQWHNGEYRVQVHYFELVTIKELRKDTDFVTTVDEKESTGKKKKPKKKPIVKIRKNVVQFDSQVEEIEETEETKETEDKIIKEK